MITIFSNAIRNEIGHLSPTRVKNVVVEKREVCFKKLFLNKWHAYAMCVLTNQIFCQYTLLFVLLLVIKFQKKNQNTLSKSTNNFLIEDLH